MPGLRDQFAHFYALDEDAIATAMKTGLLVPDTNVLLRLYEFKATARDELFEALENLGDRLWIPYQVGHEVHRKRIEIIAKQEKFFRDTRNQLDNAIRALRNQIEAFRSRIAWSKDDLREIEESIDAAQKLITAEVTRADKANEVRMKDRDSDKILARLEKLFQNRVGGPMKAGELQEARKEAEQRGREKIPPGYMDADKDKGDPAGDYLIWRQLITEAKTRKLPVVLITDDTKEDWYRREHNDLFLGARYELRQEMMREAGVPLLLITTRTFIDYAEKYLNAEFSEDTVEQAEELPSPVGPSDILPSPNVTRLLLEDWWERQRSASAPNSERTNVLLRGIATGTIRDPAELALAMFHLRTELDRAGMVYKVASAVGDGQGSGALSVEDGNAVLEALSRSLDKQQEAELIVNSANQFLPVRRAAFERALEVVPGRDDPGEVVQARKTIAMNLERNQATPDDKDRAVAWLEQYNQWLHPQVCESQEGPPSED